MRRSFGWWMGAVLTVMVIIAAVFGVISLVKGFIPEADDNSTLLQECEGLSHDECLDVIVQQRLEAQSGTVQNRSVASAEKSSEGDVVTSVTDTVQVTSILESNNIFDVVGFRNNRNQVQVPDSCSIVGMCPWNFDIAAQSYDVATGSPWSGYGIDRSYFDASKGQGNIVVFYNDTDLDVSIKISAWAGANSLNGLANAGFEGSLEEPMQKSAIMASSWMVDPSQGNCGINGCPIVGYTVLECSANDTCRVIYDFDPVKGLDQAPHAPWHQEFLEVTHQS